MKLFAVTVMALGAITSSAQSIIDNSAVADHHQTDGNYDILHEMFEVAIKYSSGVDAVERALHNSITHQFDVKENITTFATTVSSEEIDVMMEHNRALFDKFAELLVQLKAKHA